MFFSWVYCFFPLKLLTNLRGDTWQDLMLPRAFSFFHHLLVLLAQCTCKHRSVSIIIRFALMLKFFVSFYPIRLSVRPSVRPSKIGSQHSLGWPPTYNLPISTSEVQTHRCVPGSVEVVLYIDNGAFLRRLPGLSLMTTLYNLLVQAFPDLNCHSVIV